MRIELIFLSIRIIISVIFISSSITKIFNMTSHIAKVRQYKIIPNKVVKTFSILETIIELIASILLIIGLYFKLSAFILIFLLVVYTIAISINLIRGNINFDCGCGGIVGNHQLSWKLVMRNLLLGYLLYLIVVYNPYIATIDNASWFQISIYEASIIICSLLIVIFYSSLNYLFHLHNIFQNIHQDYKRSR